MWVALEPFLEGLLSAEWCLAQWVGGAWLAVGGAIAALVAAPPVQIAADLAPGVGTFAPTGDAGLTGAAVGTLCLVLLSTPGRAPEATRSRSA
jgi:hypothetical protein